MRGIWRFYLTWQARLHTIEKVIAALLLLMIAGVVLAGTLSRYILKEPWFGTDRLATYLFMILCFWGIQMASSYYEHIQVEVLATWVRGRSRALLGAGASLVSALFLMLLAGWGYRYVRLSAEQGEMDLVLGIPLWWAYVFFVLAMGMSALRYLIAVGLWLEVWRGGLNLEAFQKKTLL